MGQCGNHDSLCSVYDQWAEDQKRICAGRLAIRICDLKISPLQAEGRGAFVFRDSDMTVGSFVVIANCKEDVINIRDLRFATGGRQGQGQQSILEFLVY